MNCKGIKGKSVGSRKKAIMLKSLYSNLKKYVFIKKSTVGSLNEKFSSDSDYRFISEKNFF